MQRLIDQWENQPTIDAYRMLTIQYRMNEAIMNWSNGRFYKSALIADTSVSGHLLR